METALLLAILALLAAVLVILLLKTGGAGIDPALRESLRELSGKLEALNSASQQIQALQTHLHATVGEELGRGRNEVNAGIQGFQTQLAAGHQGLQQSTTTLLNQANANLLEGLRSVSRSLDERLKAVSEDIAKLTGSNEVRIAEVRKTLENSIRELREDNATQLEKMRATVDEKLQTTLEKRLSESFTLVSERLAAVHAGLGEMQNLAAGVGDLKKVLTNVKTRGGWGEVQLGMLIDQILTPSQYERNVSPNPLSREVVEYAIRLPGRDNGDGPVWLPVDAKFFVEDYTRLHEAQEAADLDAVAASSKGLRDAVLSAARDISTKYVNPPHTTDFAVMFVPTEGLFAEIIRLPELTTEIQAKHRVVIAGPTTFAALLNSLQMGFRTLAIQQQSGEVWKTLGLVKTEFAKFGASLDAVKKSLQAAANRIDDVGVRTRAVTRSLRGVEELPGNLPGIPSGDMIPSPSPDEGDED